MHLLLLARLGDHPIPPWRVCVSRMSWPAAPPRKCFQASKTDGHKREGSHCCPRSGGHPALGPMAGASMEPAPRWHSFPVPVLGQRPKPPPGKTWGSAAFPALRHTPFPVCHLRREPAAPLPLAAGEPVRGLQEPRNQAGPGEAGAAREKARTHPCTHAVHTHYTCGTHTTHY